MSRCQEECNWSVKLNRMEASYKKLTSFITRKWLILLNFSFTKTDVHCSLKSRVLILKFKLWSVTPVVSETLQRKVLNDDLNLKVLHKIYNTASVSLSPNTMRAHAFEMIRPINNRVSYSMNNFHRASSCSSFVYITLCINFYTF